MFIITSACVYVCVYALNISLIVFMISMHDLYFSPDLRRNAEYTLWEFRARKFTY